MMKENNHETSIIEVTHLQNRFGEQWVHKDLNFSIKRKEIIAVIGASGCGKTTLLHSILMLHKPTSGSIKVFGIDVTHCTQQQALSVQHRWGVMFQNLALFSSLRVWENIVFPVQRFSMLKSSTQKQLALMKLVMVGLKQTAAPKYPSEISGGMAKRVALARAIVLDPELVFLDEPASGLDPVSTVKLGKLVLELRDILGITFFMITHDVATLKTVPDRVLFLGEGKVLDFAPISELVKNPHPLIQEYFSGTHFEFNQKEKAEK